MATEVERKFLVSETPADATREGGTDLRQGYLASEGDVEVRLRYASGDARLTVKAGTGLVRAEVELPVASADADALWPHTAGRRIEKTRYRVPLGDVTAELDVYAGDLDGLRVVEVEFPDADAAAAFVPPPWFGTEVTGRGEWSNAALARSGIPDSGEGAP